MAVATHHSDESVQLRPETEPDPDWMMIWRALNNPRWDFRTTDGLARETGLSKEQIHSLLARHQRDVRQAYVPDRRGRPLYAPAERKVGWRELLATTRAFIAKAV